MPPHAYFLTKFGTDTFVPKGRFGLNLLAFCLNSGCFVWRPGPPAAGVGFRGNCHLGAFFFPRASFFSTFLRTLARSARAYLLVIVFSWLVVHFLVLRRVGSACAGSAPRSPRCSLLPLPCEPRAAGGCMSAELGGANFFSSLSCMLVVHRANPSFPHVFRFSRRRLESVCVSSIHCLV